MALSSHLDLKEDGILAVSSDSLEGMFDLGTLFHLLGLFVQSDVAPIVPLRASDSYVICVIIQPGLTQDVRLHLEHYELASSLLNGLL